MTQTLSPEDTGEIRLRRAAAQEQTQNLSAYAAQQPGPLRSASATEETAVFEIPAWATGAERAVAARNLQGPVPPPPPLPKPKYLDGGVVRLPQLRLAAPAGPVLGPIAPLERVVTGADVPRGRGRHCAPLSPWGRLVEVFAIALERIRSAA